VDSKTASQGAYSTDHPSFQSGPSQSDRTAHPTTVRLTWGVSLMVTSLISLGLWASIWLVGTTLVSAGLW
jgi:hypothetical protein